MPNHQASEQMLGYLYQVRYALALLLGNDNSDCQISIESISSLLIGQRNFTINCKLLSWITPILKGILLESLFLKIGGLVIRI